VLRYGGNTGIRHQQPSKAHMLLETGPGELTQLDTRRPPRKPANPFPCSQPTLRCAAHVRQTRMHISTGRENRTNCRSCYGLCLEHCQMAAYCWRTLKYTCLASSALSQIGISTCPHQPVKLVLKSLERNTTHHQKPRPSCLARYRREESGRRVGLATIPACAC
jgi:hypothetical protein